MIDGGRNAVARLLLALARQVAAPAERARGPVHAAGGAKAVPPGSPAAVRPGSHAETQRPRDEVASGKRLAATDGQVAEWIEREARSVQAIAAAGVQLLDLSELRQRYADRWDQVGAAIRRVVELTIDRHLGPRDMWVRGEGDTWVILFEGAGRAQAAERARQIALQIGRRLVGDEAASIPAAEAAGIRVHSLAIELDADAGHLRTMRGLLASWGRALAAARAREQAAVDGLRTRLVAAYQPVLNPRRHGRPGRAIVGQRVSMVDSTAAAPLDDVTGALPAAIDLETLRCACQLLGRARGLVFAGVRFDTLAARSRRDLVTSLVAELPASAQRRLVVELRDTPPTVPQSRLLTVLTPLYPRVLAIAIAIRPGAGEPDGGLDRFAGHKHGLVTMSSADICDDPAAAGTLLRAASRLRMRAAILDVPDPRLARQLGQLCRYLAGKGAAPSALAPILLKADLDRSDAADAHACRGGDAGPVPAMPGSST